MTDYRQIIRDVPELAAKLAGQIVPSSEPGDGQPRGSNRPDAARVVAIDELDQLFREVGQSVRFWQQAFSAEWDLPPVPSIVDVVTAPRYTRSVADDPMAAARDIQPAVDWLLAQWADAEGHPLHDYWLAGLDEWLVPAVRRLEVREIAQRPRRCIVCSALDTWADTEHASAVCATCGAVMRAEVWLSVREAAKRLEVDVRTVQRWVAGDLVEHRKSGRTNQVEWGSCREHHEMAVARAKLNLIQSPNVAT